MGNIYCTIYKHKFNTMKFALAILVVLPLAFAMPEKRLLLDSLLQGDELKLLVGQLVNQLGSDSTEQACEAECHVLIQQDHLLQFGCPLVSKSLQALAHRFQVQPQQPMPTTMAP